MKQGLAMQYLLFLGFFNNPTDSRIMWTGLCPCLFVLMQDHNDPVFFEPILPTKSPESATYFLNANK